MKLVQQILIVPLFLLQLASLIRSESLVARLALCDSFFLLIVQLPTIREAFKAIYKKRRIKSEGEEVECSGAQIFSSPNLTPFLRAVGCVVVIALLFVNFSHSLEVLFCSDEPNISLPSFLIAVTLGNLLYKLIHLCTMFRIGSAEYDCFAPISTVEDPHATVAKKLYKVGTQLVFHLGASSILLGLWLGIWAGVSTHTLGIVDPLLCMGLCAMLSAIIGPLSIPHVAVVRHIPYLLCNTPDPANKLKNMRAELTAAFPDIWIEKLHAFRTWPTSRPGEEFEVIMSIVALRGSDDGNDEKHLHQVMLGMSAILKKAGAGRITIQPIKKVHDNIVAVNCPTAR